MGNCPLLCLPEGTTKPEKTASGIVKSRIQKAPFPKNQAGTNFPQSSKHWFKVRSTGNHVFFPLMQYICIYIYIYNDNNNHHHTVIIIIIIQLSEFGACFVSTGSKNKLRWTIRRPSCCNQPVLGGCKQKILVTLKKGHAQCRDIPNAMKPMVISSYSVLLIFIAIIPQLSSIILSLFTFYCPI